MNTTSKNQPASERDLHPDPLTGEPGVHLVGTSIGATAGGTTGAIIGSVAGPIGIAVGAVIGAVVGGLAGKGVAESIDPSAEDAHWREHHAAQDHSDESSVYDDWSPAYRVGYTGFRHGKTFEEREADLRMEYEGGPVKAEAAAPGTMQNNLSTNPLRWDAAREAARVAYERAERGESHRIKRAGATPMID